MIWSPDADPVNANWIPILRAARRGDWNAISQLSKGTYTEETAKEAWGHLSEALCSDKLENAKEISERDWNEFETRAQQLLEKHLYNVIVGDGVAVPDDDNEMNWRLFFAHSQDMKGFAADIFTGGANERTHPVDISFVPLRARWEQIGGNSFSLICDLAELWNDDATRAELVRITGNKLSDDEKRKGLSLATDLLLTSGVAGAITLAETLSDLKGYKIAFKTKKMVRAYIQNSALLMQHHGSLRSYLLAMLPNRKLPPCDLQAIEHLWIQQIKKQFYNVDIALANYLFCDWLLFLWRGEQINWFMSYKADSVHQEAINLGLLPNGSGEADFIAYCKRLRLPSDSPYGAGRLCPPRVLNECIWLGGNASSGEILTAT